MGPAWTATAQTRTFTHSLAFIHRLFMRMDQGNDIPFPIPASHAHATHSGRRSLPPANVLGPGHVLPTYPSSTLQHYYPSDSQPHFAQNRAHISTFSQPFTNQPYDTNNFRHPIIPLVSQFRVPSLRQTSTPSVHYSNNANIHHNSSPSPFLHQIKNVTLQHNTSSSPAIFTHHTSPIAAPQPIHPPNILLPSQSLVAHHVSHTPFQHHSKSHSSSSHVPPVRSSRLQISLPSTKDIPLLSGKRDWAPWHFAVRALIRKPNVLAYIADEP